MIATALTFVFGFLTATLIALVVSPLFWSRSRRLALREYRATIPASVREVRASLDHVRAEAAVTARRREMLAEAEIEKAARARAEAGRVAGENAELRARNTALAETLNATTADLAEAGEQLSLRDAEIEELESELRSVGNDLELRTDELEALSDRFRDLGAIADERRATIEEQDVRIEELSDAVREAERERRETGSALERLRGEVASLEAHLAKEKNAVKRLDDKVSRLTGQVSDRDDQIARLLGEAASAAAVARHGPAPAGHAVRTVANADQEVSEGGEPPAGSRLRLRPAVRPSFGRRPDESGGGEESSEDEDAAEARPARAAAPAARRAPAAAQRQAVGMEARTAANAAETTAAAKAAAAGPDGRGAEKVAPPPPSAERPATHEKEQPSSLAASLGLPERPEFSEALGDGELREKLGELAAQVIALSADRDGPRSPLDAILDAETTIAMPGRRDATKPSLADRARRLRREARDHAAE
ncbi:hypothetical protein [Jiella sonneratiae]|uniref:Chromosome partition protein Smc n=1 Tax=Jiella sonneratiae TaxID=2816856 RepID=A0ABS3J782_9HYPH|nr:hypothetical protein [Jiella sonneratiae]MBO0905541.1 hypothetical protein [Jiella sonneratiae]